jgi:hypothetical protein
VNDPGMGIIGVIIGAVLVLGIFAFTFGDRIGLRAPGGGTTVKVEAPKMPSPPIPK